MRLREMQAIMLRALPALEVEAEGTTLPSGQPGVRLRGVREVRESLRAIAQVPGFAAAAAQLLDHPVLLLEPHAALTTHSGHAEMVGKLTTLRRRVEDLLEAISAALPAQAPLSLGVLLPKTDDLEELSKLIAEISRVFALPTAAVTKDPGRFQNLDTGTDWIEIKWAFEISLEFIVALLRICAWFTRDMQKVDASVETIRPTAPISAEQTRLLDELHGARRRQVEEEAARQMRIAITSMVPDMAEENVNINLAICMEGVRAGMRLLSKGAEIQPALEAPQKIVAELPRETATRELATVAPELQLGEGVSKS